MRPLGLPIAVATALVLAGCDASPPTPAVGRPSPVATLAPTAPSDGTVAAGAGAEPVGSNGATIAQNDPSASLDTPLCGRAAREQNATAAAIAPDVEQGGGACVSTACFDPLTDTFIGADGFRHVCQ